MTTNRRPTNASEPTRPAAVDALRAVRGSAEADIRSLSESMEALRVLRSSTSDDDEHDPEGPTLSSEWSRIRGLLAKAEGRLSEAEAALARVDAGTYGLCAVCGRPIAPGRLEVRPAATRCVECASIR
jgi:DnaK suppressor protein